MWLRVRTRQKSALDCSFFSLCYHAPVFLCFSKKLPHGTVNARHGCFTVESETYVGTKERLSSLFCPVPPKFAVPFVRPRLCSQPKFAS